MGIVLLGKDPKIGRMVALKVIHHSNFTDSDHEADTIRRFHLEARAAGKLSHPNIVTVYDVGDQDEVSYIAMEFVEGRDLAAILKDEGKLPYQDATRAIVQVAHALSYSHDHGIIHRDVKPGNIMIDKAGAVKITDFGLARLQEADSITKAGHTVGSPLYMSPEQIQSGDIDYRSDIFSMGVVYYETLTGVRPFEGDILSDLIGKIIDEEPASATTLDPSLPPRVNIILRKMMAKSPRDRYQTAGAAARDMQNLLALPNPFKSMTESDAQLTTQYPGELTPLAPFRRRVRPKPATARKLLLAAALGALVGLGGVFLGGSGPALHARDALQRAADSVREILSSPAPPAPSPAQPPPSAQDEIKPARISIRSSIEGMALIDGKEVGKTPLINLSLEKGDHTAEIRAEGYQPWTRSMTVAGGDTLDFEASLSLAQGSLAIHSDPPGARVSVDGTGWGTAPVVVTGLAVGVHKAVLEMDGRLSWSQDVSIRPGNGEDISATLLPAARLKIKAPAGAMVKIDGKDAGTGNVEASVAPGTRHVEVSKAGAKTWTGAAEARAGEETELDVALAPAGFGSIKVSAAPWAEIYVNGARSGTTPKTIANIPAGQVTVRLVNPGYKPYSAKIIIEPGKQARLQHTFTGDEAAVPVR
jgi:serine/threonine protein kinase